jgi:predicted TIM-barrel fold metal-dependent hydrolase
MYADDLLRPWHDALMSSLPAIPSFDAHTHTGSHDPDGFKCSVEELTEALGQIGSRAAVFTMHEPDGYPAANDRVLAEAAASDGVLIPYCRLDPKLGGAAAAAEASRCLDAGARGIKLHPRAEEFRLEEESTEPIFAVAHERGVPVLVHAGRGIPALGRDAVDLAQRYPGARIILAHAAVCDLAWIWRHAASLPNLFFDTAWWSAQDLLTLFSLVPPGQILWGSDAPYGTPLQSQIMAFRCALQAGVAADALPVVGGGQMARLVAGQEPLPLGPAPGVSRLTGDVLLWRLCSYLQTAVARMMLREAADEYLGLARLACEVGDGAPQAPVCRSVLALLDRFDRYQAENPPELALAKPGSRFPGMHLVVTASIVALTPDVPLPPDPEPESVGERSGE